MQAEDRVDLRVLHATLFDHQLCATFFADRGHFFCGLKNEFHRTVNVIAHLREHLGHAHQDSHVGIVPAGMHHARLGTVPDSAHHAFERHIGFFDDRQGVHVGTQRHTCSGLGSL